MSEQLRWLWVATIAQLWLRTTLFGVAMTVFVRRMILWTTLGLPAAFAVGVGLHGWGKGLLMAAVLSLGGTSLFMLILLGIIGPAMWRVGAVILAGAPMLGPFLGAFLMWFPDLLWRLEAGPQLGEAQQAASRAGIDRTVLERERADFKDSVISGVTTTNADFVVSDPDVSKVRVEHGEIVGDRHGERVVVGTVDSAWAGEGIQYTDLQGNTVKLTDNAGFDSQGRSIVRPDGMTADEWQAQAETEIPVAPLPNTGRGPMGVSFTVLAVALLSFFAGDALDAYFGEQRDDESQDHAGLEGEERGLEAPVDDEPELEINVVDDEPEIEDQVADEPNTKPARSSRTQPSPKKTAPTAAPARAKPARSGPTPRAVYRARIGRRDHANSRGKSLSSARAMIRQDRANYHKFDVRDRDDATDPLFGDKSKRAWLGKLLKGKIDKKTARQIKDGTPLIEVEVWDDDVRVTIISP